LQVYPCQTVNRVVNMHVGSCRIVPADLNAYLYQMENNVANFAEELDMPDVANEYRMYADDRRRAMGIRMYDPAQGKCLLAAQVLVYLANLLPGHSRINARTQAMSMFE
jgi:hypothetical protein